MELTFLPLRLRYLPLLLRFAWTEALRFEFFDENGESLYHTVKT